MVKVGIALRWHAYQTFHFVTKCIYFYCFIIIVFDLVHANRFSDE